MEAVSGRAVPHVGLTPARQEVAVQPVHGVERGVVQDAVLSVGRAKGVVRLDAVPHGLSGGVVDTGLLFRSALQSIDELGLVEPHGARGSGEVR